MVASIPAKTSCQGSRLRTFSERTHPGSRSPATVLSVSDAVRRMLCAELAVVASNTSVPLTWKFDAVEAPASKNACSSCVRVGEPTCPRLVFLKNAANFTVVVWRRFLSRSATPRLNNAKCDQAGMPSNACHSCPIASVHCHAGASRPSPLGGLRPALTRRHDGTVTAQPVEAPIAGGRARRRMSLARSCSPARAWVWS